MHTDVATSFGLMMGIKEKQSVEEVCNKGKQMQHEVSALRRRRS